MAGRLQLLTWTVSLWPLLFFLEVLLGLKAAQASMLTWNPSESLWFWERSRSWMNFFAKRFVVNISFCLLPSMKPIKIHPGVPPQERRDPERFQVSIEDCTDFLWERASRKGSEAEKETVHDGSCDGQRCIHFTCLTWKQCLRLFNIDRAVFWAYAGYKKKLVLRAYSLFYTYICIYYTRVYIHYIHMCIYIIYMYIYTLYTRVYIYIYIYYTHIYIYF